MSLVRVGKIANSAVMREDAFYRRRYQQDWLAVTDNPSDGPITVFSAMESTGSDPVPALWSTYNQYGTQDPYVVLGNREIIHVTQDEGHNKFWTIRCEWGPPDQGFTVGGPVTLNPLLRPVVFHLEWASYQRIIDSDGATGLPLTNTAGDPFNPPVTIEDAYPVLVAVKNIATLDEVIALAVKYQNAISTDTFYGSSPGHARVESIQSGQLREENNYTYYATTIKVVFAREDTGTDENDGWDVRLVNRGTHYLDKDGNRSVPFKTEYKGVGDTSDSDNYDPVDPPEPLEDVALDANGNRKYPDNAPADFIGPFQIYHNRQPFVGTPPNGLGIGGGP